MTVHELFNTLSFDQVMDALRHTHRNDNSVRNTDNLTGYKEAFDTLRNISSGSKGGEVTFDVTPREHWSDDHSLPLVANGVEGDFWETIVGKEVIRPEEELFTDAELAGAILWGATFYGFTERRRWNPCPESFTAYGKKADRLERRLYRPYIRDKETLRELKSGEMPFGIAFTSEVWDLIRHRQSHQNRSKRKRWYRMERRIEWLRRLDRRRHMIDLILSCGGRLPISSDEIMGASEVYEMWFDSHCFGKSPRAAYLVDLLENYCPYADDIFQLGEKKCAVIYTSAEKPATAAELSEIRSFLARHYPAGAAWTLVTATDSSAGDDMSLQFIAVN